MKLKLATAGFLAGVALMLAPQANATPEQDQLLYDGMAQAGVVLFPAAYSQARRACGVMWSDAGTPDQVVDVFYRANPGWTYDQAQTFVALAIVIYCPPADMSSKYKRLYT